MFDVKAYSFNKKDKNHQLNLKRSLLAKIVEKSIKDIEKNLPEQLQKYILDKLKLFLKIDKLRDRLIKRNISLKR